MRINATYNKEICSVALTELSSNDKITLYRVDAEFLEEMIPEEFKIEISFPALDVYSTWSPSVQFDKSLGANWCKKRTESRLASFMPLHTLLSSRGNNRFTAAVSDAKTPISLSTGIREEDAFVECEIRFFTVKVAPLKNYSAIIRIDTRDIPFYDAVADATLWLETDCGYTPAYVPENAKLPMNSLWYSFHQKLIPDEIIRECQMSKPLGMDTVIIDDGWQTDNNNRGYKFCGDWELATGKIPDMRELVYKIHNTGMKVIIWYSVPFIGTGARNFEKFKDMLLDQTGNKRDYFSLDPRYKEVRNYLINIYLNAVKGWDLDGLKLDFIDSFWLGGKSLEYDERRDYQSLEDAVDRLMTDVMRALKEINSEIMIEFRQSYIGPAIRRFGNMLRVGDCPLDAIQNRQNTIALRLTSGKTAVHSDMLMWHPSDTPEAAALQIASSLFSVPQISVKLLEIPESHKKMLEFYLSFWREKRHILLDGRLRAYNPESAYSLASAELDGEAVVVSYTQNLIDISDFSKSSVVNCTNYDSLVIKGAKDKAYDVYDCMGNKVGEGVINSELCQIDAPLCGIIFVK